jgi:hypothetical protein
MRTDDCGPHEPKNEGTHAVFQTKTSKTHETTVLFFSRQTWPYVDSTWTLRGSDHQPGVFRPQPSRAHCSEHTPRGIAPQAQPKHWKSGMADRVPDAETRGGATALRDAPGTPRCAAALCHGSLPGQTAEPGRAERQVRQVHGPECRSRATEANLTSRPLSCGGQRQQRQQQRRLQRRVVVKAPPIDRLVVSNFLRFSHPALPTIFQSPPSHERNRRKR